MRCFRSAPLDRSQPRPYSFRTVEVSSRAVPTPPHAGYSPLEPAGSLDISRQQPLVLPGYTWAQYLSLDELFHDSGTRVRFLNHTLEIMPPISEAHKERKVHLGRLVDAWCVERGIEQFGRGSATLKLTEVAGGEPDESFCFGVKKEIPDLVIEVALTSGGLSKRAFYSRFQVPELWIWRDEALEVHVFDPEATAYVPSAESRVLSGLDLAAVAECAVLPSITQAVAAFRKRL